ncbi:L-aminoadipate-semialdehyde dehydrogenase-phosphopantetheinyl transferase [Cryptotermes secundus]|uniref:L-aminoadipate-semialdehyde dehydrogenase-phosphopantetheinyl transferase n=1 Tax=Cryptotermes secundus TaxID=105785 RepID=A0A2J7PDV6_9NEOP|nr:L-aminoadipate-semialdehyde dehydrogenase-phosphopantetheinyl transferase [Cryptotermes secundus]PNF14525.1 L-aminoadipate-semialdehyde dehydrogenase-phosphopantetheinyl transferase [Cryptotermes secundus]
MNGRESIRWAFNYGLWYPTEPQFQLAASCVQAEEKTRIGRFVFKKDAKASLIGRLMMRKYVSENSGLAYADIRFGRDDRGKPYLIGDHGGKPTLNFNVSHQGNYTVLAGENGNTVKVGIDVMKLEYSGGKTLSEFFRIMARHFSSHEWEIIQGNHVTSDEQRLSMFRRHWCLKESYVKATGTGITVDLQKISFRIRTDNLEVGEVVTDTELYLNGTRLEDWKFEETLLDESHCVAVALSGKDSVSDLVSFKCLDFNELMSGSTPLLSVDPAYSQNFFKKDEKR